MQNAVPIVNYNDPVSAHENRKMELIRLRSQAISEEEVVECIDNDETAAVIASLVKTKVLLILTATEGIRRPERRKDADSPHWGQNAGKLCRFEPCRRAGRFR